MSMTFSDDASERRRQGRAKLREHKARACAMANAYMKRYEWGRTSCFSFLKNRGTCFIL
jgi:hypothetical protein